MNLSDRIPDKGFSDEGAMLEAFVGWAAEAGLALYPHQEEAILELFSGSHVVLDTPTGSGKSLVAIALHFKSFAEGRRSVYTAPIKALVSEKFFALCEVFGAENVGMATGDGTVNRDAPILCCTAEILANMALRKGDSTQVDAVVMDEFHYYGDRDRGMAWQIPLLLLNQSLFLLMSATLGDTTAIRDDLEARTWKPVALVRSDHRPVPLEFEYSETPIHETIDRLVGQGKAPIYMVHFSQRAATEQAQALTSTDHSTKEEKQAIAEAVGGFRFDSPFGATLRRYVLHGVGLHHAGLLPRYRLLVEKLAQQGLLKVICGTDTLGVGINVPIRTVLFTQLCKYDGRETVILRVRDFKQIAGRAGRAGFDDVGYVVAQAPEHVIENQRAADKAAASGRKKKIARRSPPDRGYKHWDEQTFRRLVESPPEPLKSRFVVDHGRLLTMMQHAEEAHGDARLGHAALVDLIAQSHESDADKQAFVAQADDLLADLERAGVVGIDPSGRMLLDPGLQHDFSLHHTLSLFLVDALAALDRDHLDFALDVVTFTEAILEDPFVVLRAQADKARFALLAELKAAGVPYEERLELIREVSWPKPLADVLGAIFQQWSEHHPWVDEDDLHSKAVVRAMAAEHVSFADTVKDLGLQRSEGVLLRYLTDAYKALVQNVPADLRTDALLDVLAWLRALLARVDSSLVTEWEQLLAGREAGVDPAEVRIDIAADPRAFRARVRAELHALLRAFSQEDWEEAAGCVRAPGPLTEPVVGPEPWAAEAFEAALRPFIGEFGPVRFDHQARLAEHTTLRAIGPHQWEVRQALVTPPLEEGGDDDGSPSTGWAIEGRIDLRSDSNPDGPLVEILRIAE